jgi:hypothetical protein
MALSGSQAQRAMLIFHPERSGWLMVMRRDPDRVKELLLF